MSNPGSCGARSDECSWLVGPSWPSGGEIDILEGVNSQVSNDMTLHTGPGCSFSNNGRFSGSMTTQNCYVNAPGQGTNAGCQITAANPQSYGASFNADGGGVYATEWTSESINIHFFPRGGIPSDISSGNPDPSTWGTALASFSGGGCGIDTFFKDQQIVCDPTSSNFVSILIQLSFRSSIQPSVATGRVMSGPPIPPALPKRPPVSRSSRTTLLPSPMHTGQSTLSKYTNRPEQLHQSQHGPRLRLRQLFQSHRQAFLVGHQESLCSFRNPRSQHSRRACSRSQRLPRRV